MINTFRQCKIILMTHSAVIFFDKVSKFFNPISCIISESRYQFRLLNLHCTIL